MTSISRGLRRTVLRGLVLAGFVLGLNYVCWRALFSVNWRTWFISVPLLLAEVFNFVDTMLFGLTIGDSASAPGIRRLSKVWRSTC